MMRRIAIPALLAMLAACVPQRSVPLVEPTPPPIVAAPSPTPLASDWRDWPLTPGTWSYRRDARGSIALFGTPGGDAALTLRCDLAARQVYLSRAGSAAGPLTVRTTTTTRLLDVRPTGGTPAYGAIALIPGDPLLDAMGFSRGRFTVEQAGAPPLVVPAWAEIERVTEDCRG